MKAALRRLLTLMGVHHLLRFYHRHHLIVLLYHGVAPPRTFGIYNYRKKFLPPDVFRAHMSYITRHYKVLKLDEAIQRLQTNTLPPYALAITFDDGYKNFFDHALPILREFNIPATIFLTSDFVLKNKPLWVDRLEYVMGAMPDSTEERQREDAEIRKRMKAMNTNDRIKALETLEQGGVPLTTFKGDASVYAPLSKDMILQMRQYHIDIGAHTCTHPILSHLSEEEAQREIQESRHALSEAFGSISTIFAYPNGQHGDYTEKTIASLQRLGFTAALTTIKEANRARTPLFELRRITMDGIEDEDALAIAVSGLRSI